MLINSTKLNRDLHSKKTRKKETHLHCLTQSHNDSTKSNGSSIRR